MAEDRFSSESADRSWTNAIANQAVLSGLDARDYLKWLDERGPRIESVIPQFLHEVTQRWCFDSLVGRAIALLRLRAGMRAAFDSSRSQASVLAADVARYEAASTVLKPIAEGLALYAEFDARSGETRVVSQPLLALQTSFGFLLDPGHEPELALVSLLQTTRLRREFLNDRKASLYFRRFDCDDGYLAGYLTVKTLEGRLRVAVPEFEDPDLFLTYLRAFVFEDAVLARMLLANERDEELAALAIATHIAERLADLGRACEHLREQPMMRASVRQFDDALANGRTKEALGRPIMIADADVAAAERAFETSTFALLDRADSSRDTASTVAVSIIANLQMRRFAEVARARVTVGTDDAGHRGVRDESGDVLCAVADDAAIKDGTAGDLTAVISSTKSYIALILSTDHGFHVLKWFGADREEEETVVTQFAAVRTLCKGIFRVLENALRDAIGESWIAEARDTVRDESLRLATDVYLKLATLNVPSEAVQLVRDAMLSQGMRPFLDDDPNVVRTLAMVGIVNAFSADPTTIRALGTGMLDLADHQVALAIQKLEASEQFPLLSGAHESLHALV